MATRKCYMLDTDISSYIIKDRHQSVLERLSAVEMNDVYISVVTYAELRYGVEKSSSTKINSEVIELFVSHLTVLPWDNEAARAYGEICANLESDGNPIGANDLMIAAHALSQNMELITNNTRHFERVLKLKIDNWC